MYSVSGALAGAAVIAGGATLFVPNVLRGPAAMNGSARGTALVELVVAVPMLLISMGLARRWYGAMATWLAALAHLLYQSFLFFFATPFNSLFLLYVAAASLAVWATATFLAGVDPAAFAASCRPNLNRRAFAGYLGVMGLLNAFAWLGNILPALGRPGNAAFLAGTGLPTSPVYVQDLSFWVPLMLISALWLWRGRPRGYLFVPALMTWFVVESLSIAVDQYMGHNADPTSPAASGALVIPFLVLAAICLGPVTTFFRPAPRS